MSVSKQRQAHHCATVLMLAVRVPSILSGSKRKAAFRSTTRLTELLLVHLFVVGFIMLPISTRHFGLQSKPPESDVLQVNGQGVEEGAQRKNGVTKEVVILAALQQHGIYIELVSVVAATRQTLFCAVALA